ncbi:MAG: hypothetical protein ACE5Q6_18855 [Dehalococcoidia bacterium]
MRERKTETAPAAFRIPKPLLELIELWAKEQRIDKSAVIRQWLYKGGESAVVELLNQGKISKGDATVFLDLTYYEVNDLLEDRGYQVGATDEQHRQSRENAKLLRPRAEG